MPPHSMPAGPSAAGARPGWRAALRAYAEPRVTAMLFLGFSAGLPFLLVFATLSAWLAQAGIERGTIGLLSWVGITYSTKVLWAPVVDRLALPLLTRRLGRRRGWMLLAQFVLAAGLLGLSAQDPARNLQAVVLLALLVAFASATQDICIDAWRIEAAPAAQQGAMAAAYQLGYRAGLIAAGTGALLLAGSFGWSSAYLVMAALAGVGILTTLLIPEPEHGGANAAPAVEARVVDFIARRAAWPAWLRSAGAWFTGAVLCPFLDFFARNGVATGALILAFIGLFRVTDIAMGVMANPFYLELGYSLEQIGIIAKGYGIGMTILGALVGGLAVARWGTLASLVAGGLLVIASNLTFAALAWIGSPDLAWLALVISCDNFSAGFAGTAFIAYLSGLTNTAYTATQYALFSSLFTLPGKIIAGASGYVAEAIGWPLFFAYTSSLGLPALVLLAVLVRRLRRDGERVG
ncbi:MAG: AmpG family muropeptide MFS transporter [Betaproteobacteria bacterium]|nr:AmpG family muropeptide MFS transporter [Betaproteobacteria bacterium]